ncbi:MAG: ATP-binding cassette domain-containing protein, partial [Alphaproteobacteria bacterium]
QNLKIQNPQIKFQNVHFKYYENAVLEDFNLAIEPFQKIGLVGYSGAGKSTVINLLLKIFNNYQGKIIIDKSDIATLSNDDLRANIALIPQDPALFHRTIFDNISYGNVKASKQEVIDCARKAK